MMISAPEFFRHLWRSFQYGLFMALAAILVWFYVQVAKVHGDVLSALPFYKMPDADFTNVWAAGTLARTGHIAALYSSPAFEAWKEALLGRAPGLADWNAVSLTAMAVVLRHAGQGWAVIALTIISPAEYRCLSLGQFGGICGCFALGGLLLAREKPVLSGILLGLVTLKPQPAVIVPVAWLAARYWVAMLTAGVVCAVLVLTPLVWFGPQSLVLFFTQAGPAARAILQAQFPQTYQLNGVSIFWMCRSLGMGNTPSYAAQAAGALAAGILVFRAWRRGGDIVVLAALTMFLSLFVMPYAYNTDMVGYTGALAVLAARRGWRVSLLDGVLWLWPGYVTGVTYVTGFLATPVIVAVAAVMAWRQLPSPGPQGRGM
jgi:hypothetical protein